MKTISYKFLTAALVCALLFSCQKVLDQTPQGVISGEDLNTPVNVDKMVIAAYSSLGDDFWSAPYSSMWTYGSIRSGDAYKGGDGLGDNQGYHFYETFTLNRVDNDNTDGIWFRLYVAIARSNDALSRINAMTEEAYPLKLQRQAEMRFLRGHFYFLLKILFKHVPYIDETIPKTEYDKVSNRDLTSEELWNKITDDFRFAMSNLPNSQAEIGRSNKYTAEAYLAKALLYQAYLQGDDSNEVTSIDQTKLAEVNTLCDDVINSSAYDLSPDFANNFLTQYENGPEAVFAIQYSKDDGTPKGRLDNGHSLNYPMNQEYGCCSFHCPSDNLVNSFKTETGLPMITTFNNNDIAEKLDFQTNTFDPRLDHTVAIPEHPYKYEPDFVYQKNWARSPQIYGYFMSMKETVAADDPSFQKIPPFMTSSKNWSVIRFADVLLFKAEALIEMGRQNEALPLINRIRTRAANSTSLLKKADGTSPSNYGIDTYKPGLNCVWDQNYARQALRFERRLEFAMEGYRFFDLVRWGVASTYLNDYFAVEKQRKSYLATATFTKNRDEYLPIPLNQINFSKGLYKQNTGW